jgi:exosome complex component RRP41
MRDLVSSIAVGKVEEQLVLDVMDEEDKQGDADMPVAMMPNKNLVTLLQMDGLLTHEEFTKGMELARVGCLEVHKKQKEALEEHFQKSMSNDIEEE